jgi:hypothetical protein
MVDGHLAEIVLIGHRGRMAFAVGHASETVEGASNDRKLLEEQTLEVIALNSAPKDVVHD